MSLRGTNGIPALGSTELTVTELEAAGGALGLSLLCHNPQVLDSSLLSSCAQVGPPRHASGFGVPGLRRAPSPGGKHSPRTRGDTGMGTALGLPLAPAGQEGFGGSRGYAPP